MASVTVGGTVFMIRSSLVQIMACHLFGAYQLSEPMLLILNGTIGSKYLLVKFKLKFKKFEMSSAKWRPFCFGLNVLIMPGIEYIPRIMLMGRVLLCFGLVLTDFTPVTQGYRQTSDISRTKSQNLNVLRLVSQLSLRSLLKPGVKSRIKV